MINARGEKPRRRKNLEKRVFSADALTRESICKNA